jgi:hypothetical protein
MSAIAELKKRVYSGVYQRAVSAGRVPRRSYAHYFLEDEGIRSRIHLQNFYSTFWPEAEEPATAHVRAFTDRGTLITERDVRLPRFGSMFLEVSDLIGNAEATQGMVAVDLEPPASVSDRFCDLPSPDTVHINTPFWMAYRDADENYMYVHSIDTMGGDVFGTTAPLRWQLARAPVQRLPWRSWRLLDVDLLDEIQVVAMNHGQDGGTTEVGIFSQEGRTLWSQSVDLAPRQLQRVRVPAETIRAWRSDHAVSLVRIGLEPLLTANGKPYVMMRYGGGPLSLHHG